MDKKYLRISTVKNKNVITNFNCNKIYTKYYEFQF